MSRRGAIAGGILALWLVGLAVLTRREVFGGEGARLARAALFVAPGVEYYEITDGTRLAGFASSTIDTTPTSFLMVDQVTADLPTSGAGTQRLAARSWMILTRTLRLARFGYEHRGELPPYRMTGTVFGDTLLEITVVSGNEPPRKERVRLGGSVVLPTMVPMAIALGERPRVGTRYTADIFDPAADSLSRVTVHVRAESLFVVPDSAIYDDTAGRWVAASEDTVRAWRIEQEGGGPLTGWIDGRGRMVQAIALGRLTMRRTAYELAFSNWRRGSAERDTARISGLSTTTGHPPPTDRE